MTTITIEEATAIRLEPGHILVFKMPIDFQYGPPQAWPDELRARLQAELGFKVPIIIVPADWEIETVDATALKG